MNRFAKMKKERIYTLLGTLSEPEYVKKLVKAPEEYEFTCFLAIGYAAKNAHICKQKEIRVEDRIHHDVW